jgi:predicted SnoaL-like aldol condensation-catalyzing enzyme
MRYLTALAAAMLLAGCNIVVEDDPADQATTTTGEPTMAATPPLVPADHAPLLASTDPRLAANKRLVYDMYRIVVQEYIRNTRPERGILDTLELPMINIMAEGDYVTIAFVRPETGPDGETYYSTWFDMFRIQDGRIAEHWDPMLKTDTPIDPNSKRID